MVIRLREIGHDDQIPIPSHCIDIWDHACLLFEHHYSQSALHQLSTLESQISCSHWRTVLFMNIGIIFCHLGEYAEAKHVLAKAVTSGCNLPMAFFLLGIADFELGLYDSANSAFKDAGSTMDIAGIDAINYECGGSDYTLTITLTSEEVKQNEVSSAYASTLVGKQGRMYPVLHRLPAGLLFKHPIATPIHEGVRSGGLTAIDRHEEEAYATSQTSSSRPSLGDHKPASTGRLRVKKDYSQSDGSEEVRSSDIEQTETLKRSFPMRLLRHRKSERITTTIPNNTNDSVVKKGTHHSRIALDRKKSRSQHMLCREPQIKNTSPRELSSFLAETQPKLANKAPKLQPRDARVQHHGMSELEKFTRDRMIRDSMVQTRHTEYSLNTEERVEKGRAAFTRTSIQGSRGGVYHLQSTCPNTDGPNEKLHVRRSSVYSLSEGVCSSRESIGHDMIDTPISSPVFRRDSSTLGQAAYWTLETEHGEDRQYHMFEEVAGSNSSTDSLISTASDIDEPISTPKRNKLVRRQILRMLEGLPKTSIEPIN